MTPFRVSKVHRSRKYTRAPSPLLVLSQQKHGHGNKESGASPNQLVERVTSRVYLHRSYGCPHPLSIHTRFSPHYRYHISPTNERLSETNTQSAYMCICRMWHEARVRAVALVGAPPMRNSLNRPAILIDNRDVKG